MFSTPGFAEMLNQFNAAIQDCRTIYQRAGKEIVDSHPDLIQQRPQAFIDAMEDLHRGLLLKLFVSIAGVNHVYNKAEESFASVLFFHLWKQQMNGEPLRSTLRNVQKKTSSLTWESLVRPFVELPPLRDRVAELETVLVRVGNLVAKADGQATTLEISELQSIQQELIAILHRYEHPSRDVQRENESQGKNAVYQIQDDSQQVGIGVADGPQSTSSKQNHGKGQVEKPTLEQAMGELDQLVGLENVKREVTTLANFLKVQQIRESEGLPSTQMSLHMVFQGNPGTGKTTVARIVGHIFAAMGILQKGHLIETDRSGLVAEYAGQTGPKTNKKMDAALDGVLFIDEAYSLVAEEAEDPYGRECVQTLLKRMEDDRDRLVVILAGYPREMKRLLDSNPGLNSRFGQHFDFPDYAPRQLGQIFGLMCEQNHYQIRDLAQARLMIGLQWLFDHRSQNFGNGRLVRNVFEKSIRAMANRVVAERTMTRDLLTKFHPEDMVLDGVPPERLTERILERQKFQIVCPQCALESRVASTYLGKRVICKKCEKQFRVMWGIPLPENP